MVTRTFAQKQAAARAVVAAREVSRISRGQLTSRERSVEFREGTGTTLARAEARLEAARTVAPPTFDPRAEAIRYTTMAFPREPVPRVFREPPREYYARAFARPEEPPIRMLPPPPPPEPLRVTRMDMAPPMPTAEVFMGTRLYGAGVIPVFEEMPISEMPLAIAPEGYEFAPLEYGIRPYEKEIGIKEKVKAKVIEKVTPEAFEVAAGFISIPVGLGKTVIEDIVKVVTLKGDLRTPRMIGEAITGEFLFKPETREFISRVGRVEQRAIGELAGIAVTSRLLGKGIRFVREAIPPIAAKISPRYVTFKYRGGILAVEKTLIGKAGKPIPLRIAPPTIRISIPAQVGLAGQVVTAVTAAKDLFKVFRPEVVVKKELFADPFARIRIGRLPLEEPPRATFEQLLAGEVAFGRPKPQVAVFPDVIVAEFPKELSKVKAKLKAKKRLTEAEQAALLKWRLKPTAEFKPLGFITPEPEITLAPDDIIRKTKKIGVTVMDSKVVPIFEAEVIKPTKQTKSLLGKLERGTLTKSELARLRSRFKRETGYSLSRALETEPYYDPTRALKILSPIISPRPRVAPRVPVVKPLARIPEYKPIKALDLLAPKPLRPRMPPRAKPLAQVLGIPTIPFMTIPKPPRLGRPFKLTKKEREDRKKRKRVEYMARKQRLAYQASVGAVTLGITAPRIPKIRLTGLELRPVIKKRKKKKKKKKSYSNNYINNLNKILG